MPHNRVGTGAYQLMILLHGNQAPPVPSDSEPRPQCETESHGGQRRSQIGRDRAVGDESFAEQAGTEPAIEQNQPAQQDASQGNACSSVGRRTHRALCLESANGPDQEDRQPHRPDEYVDSSAQGSFLCVSLPTEPRAAGSEPQRRARTRSTGFISTGIAKSTNPASISSQL